MVFVFCKAEWSSACPFIHVASFCDLVWMGMIRIKNITPKYTGKCLSICWFHWCCRNLCYFSTGSPKLNFSENGSIYLIMTASPVKNHKPPPKKLNPSKTSKALGTGTMDLFSLNVSFRTNILPSQSGAALLDLDKTKSVRNLICASRRK